MPRACRDHAPARRGLESGWRLCMGEPVCTRRRLWAPITTLPRAPRKLAKLSLRRLIRRTPRAHDPDLALVRASRVPHLAGGRQPRRRRSGARSAGERFGPGRDYPRREPLCRSDAPRRRRRRRGAPRPLAPRRDRRVRRRAPSRRRAPHSDCGPHWQPRRGARGQRGPGRCAGLPRQGPDRRVAADPRHALRDRAPPAPRGARAAAGAGDRGAPRGGGAPRSRVVPRRGEPPAHGIARRRGARRAPGPGWPASRCPGSPTAA